MKTEKELKEEQKRELSLHNNKISTIEYNLKRYENKEIDLIKLLKKIKSMVVDVVEFEKTKGVSK